MSPKFKRTYTAAQVEMQSKWELIEAIAEDANDAAVPISGAESCVAAKAALEAAGNEYSDETVKHLCLVAKFDTESTAKQKRVWRRYGWTILRRVASAGWSQEAAFDLLVGDQKSFRDVMAAVGHKQDKSGVRAHPGTLPERWRKWAQDANKVMMQGTELAALTEEAGLELDGDAAFAQMIYERITERHIDAELRDLLDSSQVD